MWNDSNQLHCAGDRSSASLGNSISDPLSYNGLNFLLALDFLYSFFSLMNLLHDDKQSMFLPDSV
jgi:hypothetical protein